MSVSMQDILNPGATENKSEFPHAPTGWSMRDAESLASQQNITLTDDHWQAVRALQEYFARHEEKKPNVREIHDALNERFHAQGGIKYMYQMFPGGPIAQGCQLAGIAPPAGVADESFGSVQ